MRKELPIGSAPKDGRKITIVWIDDDDQRNETVGQYRALEQLRAGGGDWDETDTGWWIYIDSNSQKKVAPVAWISETDDHEEDEE